MKRTLAVRQDPEVATVSPGDRVYYTGDMANSDQWGTVQHVSPLDVVLLRDDGDTMHVYPSNIGNVYRGHGSPRFVTKAAYDAFRAEQIAHFFVG